jgi:hypothetical protein
MSPKRSYIAAAVVLGILFAPYVMEQLPIGAAGLRAPAQIGAILLAACVTLGYWLLSRFRLRLHFAVMLCFLLFAVSIVPYLFVSLGQVHEAYLGCLLQYTAYPLIVALFLPSVLSPRRIIRLCCLILTVPGLLTGLFTALNLARGRLPMLHPVSLSSVYDADSMVLGALGLITLTVMQPREQRTGRRQRLKRFAWIASAVVLAALALTTFSRATMGGFLAALLMLWVLRRRGPRFAAGATRAIIFACAAVPLLVCTNLITPEMLGKTGALIIRKRAVEQIYGSTLMRRALTWQAFVSRISWTDVVGTRPALHEYDYYHDLGVKRTVETPHNYWISLLLTAGYGGVLAVLALWDYAARLVRRARDPVARWVLPWLVFLSVQGITGRGAFLGLMTLAFWCFVAAALASNRGFVVSFGQAAPRRRPAGGPVSPEAPLTAGRPPSSIPAG